MKQATSPLVTGPRRHSVLLRRLAITFLVIAIIVAVVINHRFQSATKPIEADVHHDIRTVLTGTQWGAGVSTLLVKSAPAPLRASTGPRQETNDVVSDPQSAADPSASAQRAFDREARDPQWASDAESRITVAVDSQAIRGYYDIQLECKSTQCRITASIDSAVIGALGPIADWETSLAGLLDNPDWKESFEGESTRQTINQETGLISFQSYLHRRVPTP